MWIRVWVHDVLITPAGDLPTQRVLGSNEGTGGIFGPRRSDDRGRQALDRQFDIRCCCTQGDGNSPPITGVTPLDE